MSLFGYPADIIHHKAQLDAWNRVTGFSEVFLKAKVVEEQKLIKNSKGEEVQSMIEVHIEGSHIVTMLDEFVYQKDLGNEIRFRPLHYEVKKNIGTDDVKKLIIYG